MLLDRVWVGGIDRLRVSAQLDRKLRPIATPHAKRASAGSAGEAPVFDRGDSPVLAAACRCGFRSGVGDRCWERCGSRLNSMMSRQPRACLTNRIDPCTSFLHGRVVVGDWLASFEATWRSYSSRSAWRERFDRRSRLPRARVEEAARVKARDDTVRLPSRLRGLASGQRLGSKSPPSHPRTKASPWLWSCCQRQRICLDSLVSIRPSLAIDSEITCSRLEKSASRDWV